MSETLKLFLGLLIPFAGTTAGAACVFFLRRRMGDNLQKSLLGFAAGVMVAASVFSLLLPAIEDSSDLGKWAFFPAAAGTALGLSFLLVLDKIIPHLHANAARPEGFDGVPVKLSRSALLCFAITLHNIPEGMAVGVVFAGAIGGDPSVSVAAAFTLAAGIAIQNFPEGAVVSMPLRTAGTSRKKAFLLGTLSGLVEPVAALLTILLADLVAAALPYLLSFAAGAMLYVVVEELIPEASEGEHSNHGTVSFGVGFILMMILDVALG
ncbi:MAG: ZIP family metal transporter [Opitutales bacterium]|nr:ZIP family metal transporter [Opitutales bacterium]